MTVDTTEQPIRSRRTMYRQGAGNAVYGLGLFGAWFYYLSTATSIWIGLLGILKGIFWPAFLVYELMKFLGM